jgi:hypothetical protein
MSSLTLLRHLFGSGQRYRHNPVFQREMRQRFYNFWITLPEVWVMLLLAASGPILAAIFFPDISLWYYPCLCLCLPLGLWFLVYPLVVLAIMSTLAPVIVRERELHTWETLRVTPLLTETILLGKARAALTKLHYRTLWTLIGLALIVGSLLTAALLLEQSGVLDDFFPGDPLVFNGLILLLLASGCLFFAERVQQAALFSAAALAVSASARTTRAALVGTLTSIIVLWIADLMFVQLVVAAFPRRETVSPLAVFWLGSPVVYGALESLSGMYVCIALTFTVREIAVRVLWRWAVRAARSV